MKDLFKTYGDNPETLPNDLLAILDKYSAEDQTYESCSAMLAECEAIGYTFKYYLDAVPFDLRRKREYRNEELKNVVELAIDRGYQVWTFESPGKYIEQVFITDGTQIGTVSADYSGVRFGTVHKPCRECGTSYGLQSEHIINSSIFNIQESFVFAPSWSTHKQRQAINKYTDWAEYLQKNAILTYYQLPRPFEIQYYSKVEAKGFVSMLYRVRGVKKFSPTVPFLEYRSESGGWVGSSEDDTQEHIEKVLTPITVEEFNELYTKMFKSL